ncbi:MAG: SDR family NAD(P)-dependent oxidoreductase [Thermoleophilia bacterium]|nr:SDR family NAD(P)-dependent oxidoreductase [Thermoleophilia bacterium]MDH3724675.1 SDR family NAD(P)-dependent oxidoreductase [Thermoleophilia bacterium]
MPIGPPPGAALVTGASSGIGRAYAESLAQRGYEVIAVARRERRLRELVSALNDRGPRAPRFIVADLSKASGLQACRDAIGPTGVDVAVLNAGFGSLGPVAEADRRGQADMVRLNCVAVVDLACHVLPGMVRRGRGAVVVVSSAAADQPIPFMSTYAASKAFGLHFTEALAEELRGTGVRAIAVSPGPVRTEFGDSAAGALSWPVPYSRAERVVERTWEGLRRGRGRVGVGPVSMLSQVARPLPRVISLRLAGHLHRRRAGRAAPS